MFRAFSTLRAQVYISIQIYTGSPDTLGILSDQLALRAVLVPNFVVSGEILVGFLGLCVRPHQKIEAGSGLTDCPPAITQRREGPPYYSACRSLRCLSRNTPATALSTASKAMPTVLAAGMFACTTTFT